MKLILACVFVCALLSVAAAMECAYGMRFCGGSRTDCFDPDSRCDGHATCSDGSDDLGCGRCRFGFLCDGSYCISEAHRCDGVVWCHDGTDEANCTTMKSKPACDARTRCNGIVSDNLECTGQNDEVGCTPQLCQLPATADSFSGGRCRDPNARCNGVLNFPDERDEDNCTECNGGAVFCDGQCLSASQVCDGVIDCEINENDETNCTSCKGDSFLCDGTRCVSNSLRCDGVAWCRDGADEANCKAITSPPKCNATERCNGVDQDDRTCWSLGDEIGCTPETCQAPATKESFHAGKCRVAALICDGNEDYHDKKDEEGCTECQEGSLLCDGRCIRKVDVCDGSADCSNGEDELNCTSCAAYSFLCDGSRCIKNYHLCDGVVWCQDGSDEANCTEMRDSGWQAGSRCNGVPDSEINEDEIGCTPEMCQAPASKETFSGGKCRDPGARCNGVTNFPDEPDEENCTECTGGAFLCDGRCRPAFEICDGTVDCSDGRDELNCTSCQAGSFLCDGAHCVDNRHMCATSYWCKDSTDDQNCDARKPNLCRPASRCNGVQDEDCATKDDELHCDRYQCQYPSFHRSYCDGKCLPTWKWCDGHVDCKDGKDEEKCEVQKQS